MSSCRDSRCGRRASSATARLPKGRSCSTTWASARRRWISSSTATPTNRAASSRVCGCRSRPRSGCSRSNRTTCSSCRGTSRTRSWPNRRSTVVAAASSSCPCRVRRLFKERSGMPKFRQRWTEPLARAPYPNATTALPCQACGGSSLESFYELNNVPAHSCLLLPTRAEALAFPRGDIELVFCHDCGFIGNVRFDIGLNQYSAAYEETQAFSPRFLRFLDEICNDQIRKFGLGPGVTALEIGCGKGEFLTTLCELSGCSGIGIDPGYRPERNRSSAAGRMQFIVDLYGPRYAHLQAEYVCCRHTLEHIAPVQEFVRLVRETIGDRRHVNVFFELPDMERVLEQGIFLDVYYEHCTYFTRGSLARLFRAEGFDVEGLYKAYDDQYLMVEAKPVAGPTIATLPQEDDLASTAALVKKFTKEVDNRLQELSEAE